jgi:hypothetical protein
LVLSGAFSFQLSISVRNFRTKYKNGEFEIDMLMDSDVISSLFAWTLVLFLIHVCFVAHKILELKFLIWKPHPTNPSDVNANNQNINRIKESSLYEMLFSYNYMKSLLGMVFMDKNGLFQTNFEYMVFTSVYLIHSFYYSANGLINDYIKKVILHFIHKV